MQATTLLLRDATPAAPGLDPVSLICIRPLREADRAAVVMHLLALPPGERQARFGATLGEAALRRHADGLDLALAIGAGALDAAGALVAPRRLTASTWRTPATPSR